jgi:hypothetical protein
MRVCTGVLVHRMPSISLSWTGDPCQALEENAASVYGYTGMAHYDEPILNDPLPWRRRNRTAPSSPQRPAPSTTA